ncbi:TetR/AcrR family transcriptional regulator [Kineosporia babensis]|uniref:TetR/AcrR family transcriptional regulator n=1 Tax=Kineosporia babensis TaxID=499548 RepID=A0A9X1NBC9_9ACTN|nr:TetR/AcrR family transcriptional regulator [Kineosporia babensis]
MPSPEPTAAPGSAPSAPTLGRQSAGAGGRPMSPETTESILRAAIEVLAEAGVEQFTIRAVVARCGVSSATVYRRWPSKEALILATIAVQMDRLAPAPQHVSLRADAEHLTRNLVHVLQDTPVGPAFRYLVNADRNDPEVSEVATEWLIRRRAVVEQALATAVARGEARHDLPLAHAAELLGSPIYYRYLVSHRPLDEEFIDLHVREYLQWVGRR